MTGPWDDTRIILITPILLDPCKSRYETAGLIKINRALRHRLDTRSNLKLTASMFIKSNALKILLNKIDQ